MSRSDSLETEVTSWKRPSLETTHSSKAGKQTDAAMLRSGKDRYTNRQSVLVLPVFVRYISMSGGDILQHLL